jgi:carbon-monoxide dehydrogenase large subunit
LIEKAAAAAGLDPIEVRRRNLLSKEELPLVTPTGERLDSGDFLQLLERVQTLSDYQELRRLQVVRRARGELVGIGVCSYIEPCGKGWESACIRTRSNGQVTVACGTSSQGQGHRTALAQIAADCLGVPLSSIEIIEGDTHCTPEGVGALASRSIAIGGSAIKHAAEQLISHLAGADPLTTDHEVSVIYHAPHEAWSSGCGIATVAIDQESGVLRVEKLFWVDDAGLVINPKLAEGQLLGGLAQGLGQILCEHIYYDDDGQLLTGSLMDYALLRADQMPEICLQSINSTTDANVLGAKGVGESGCIIAPALIYSAALDALHPLGVTEVTVPLTSENIWRAMQCANLSRVMQ